jgi:hypothetical protein
MVRAARAGVADHTMTADAAKITALVDELVGHSR